MTASLRRRKADACTIDTVVDVQLQDELPADKLAAHPKHFERAAWMLALLQHEQAGDKTWHSEDSWITMQHQSCGVMPCTFHKHRTSCCKWRHHAHVHHHPEQTNTMHNATDQYSSDMTELELQAERHANMPHNLRGGPSDLHQLHPHHSGRPFVLHVRSGPAAAGSR